MRVCAVVKYPPIEGGVAAQSYWMARALAQRGHQVHVVTNANEVEFDFRVWMTAEDLAWLSGDYPGGGSVTMLSTGLSPEFLMHIPQSNPYVTKLASLAAAEARSRQCDLLFSYYYEPYGVSAHLASTWTGLPHVAQSAGSDRSRLMAHPELSSTYVQMLRSASLVITGGRRLEGLGIAPDRLVSGGQKPFLPPQLFNPDVEPLDVDALIGHAAGQGHPWVSNCTPLGIGRAMVGVYGKVGVTKGSFDLLRALSQLSRRGLTFNLLAMVGGRDRRSFVDCIHELGLAEHTWYLPFLPHWRVPSFIRACTCVCFLERRFPVAVHAPAVAREILACGTCAVISEEIARKQPFAEQLRDGENAFIVRDPQDVDGLASVLERAIGDPDWTAAIGRRGASLVEGSDIDEFADFYADLLEQALSLGPPGDAGATRAVDTAPARAVVDVVRRHMPASCRVVGPHVEDAFDALALPDQVPWSSVPGLALRLADRLLDGLATGAADPHAACVMDVARHERENLWLAVDTESEAGCLPFKPAVARPGLDGGTPMGERVPVRSSWVRVVEFAHDVERAVDAIAGGCLNAGDPLLKKRALFVYQKRGNLSGRVFKINEATRQLLALCDGRARVSDIERLAGAGAGVDQQRVRNILTELARAQVVALV